MDEDTDRTDEQGDNIETSGQENTTGLPGLSIEKIGSFDMNGEIVSRTNAGITSSGIVYMEDGMYGIISPDGKNDTGAKYYAFQNQRNYYSVIDEIPDETDEIVSHNCWRLIDGLGNNLIDDKYAKFECLNDRFIKVTTITGTTENEDEAILYQTERNGYVVDPEEGDKLFTGKWEIIDLKKNSLVPGVEGSINTLIEAYGPHIQYTTDNGQRRIVDSNGNDVVGVWKGLGKASSALEKTAEAAVYDINEDVVFTYNPNEYSVVKQDAERFIGKKIKEDNQYFCILDDKGTIISTEFEDIPFLIGDLVLYNHHVLDYSGNEVVEGEFNHLYVDEVGKSIYSAQKEYTDYTVFDKEGTILTEGDVGKVFNGTSLSDKNGYYYSFLDNDYTIKSYGSGLPWVTVVTNGNGRADLVDLRNNNTLLEGYRDYLFNVTDGTSSTYVYAEKIEGGYDVFEIK